MRSLLLMLICFVSSCSAAATDAIGDASPSNHATPTTPPPPPQPGNGTQSEHHPVVRTPNRPTERCYGVYGCFSIARPWTSSIRPINHFPESADTVLPVYCLYTRHNRSRCQHLVTGDAGSLQKSGLDPTRKVLFIVHGYLEHGNKKWIKRAVEEALVHDNLNVIVVDWVGGSGPPYTQAVANIRLIGVMLAHLILFLNFQMRIPPENCHIAGHSLGAHLAGYAGQYLRDRGLLLGRITGMDPADPYFENTEPMIRLDPTDALFVDVMHTDAGPIISGGLGLMHPSGHVDFYPNGGVQQPGCGTSVLDSIEKERGSVLYGLSRFIGCNHIRAVEFFTESFNSACPFLAVQCPSYAEFLAGQCHCANGNCFQMGYKADVIAITAASDDALGSGYMTPAALAQVRQSPASTRAFLLTRDDQPFCLYHYRITIVISDTLESVQRGGDRGWLSIQLHGDERSSPPTRLTQDNVRFEPRKAYTYVIGSPWLGTSVKSATLVWNYSSSMFNPLTWRLLSAPSLHVNRIIVRNLETNNSTVICGEDAAIGSRQARHMFPDSRCRTQTWHSAASHGASAPEDQWLASFAEPTSAPLFFSPSNAGNSLRRRYSKSRRSS